MGREVILKKIKDKKPEEIQAFKIIMVFFFVSSYSFLTQIVIFQTRI